MVESIVCLKTKGNHRTTMNENVSFTDKWLPERFRGEDEKRGSESSSWMFDAAIEQVDELIPFLACSFKLVFVFRVSVLQLVTVETFNWIRMILIILLLEFDLLLVVVVVGVLFAVGALDWPALPSTCLEFLIV